MESNFRQVFFGDTPKKHVIYRGTVLQEKYTIIADLIENFEVRDDDVWICSYPRSGSTWTQEMVWSIANDLDFEGARVAIDRRIPYLENTSEVLLDDTSASGILKCLGNLAESPSPRIIKSHLPLQLLPRQLREREKRCKMVYVSRNPKDACVSLYHHYGMVGFRGTFEDLCGAFLDDKVVFTPYWSHVNGYRERKDDENLLCIEFEDLKSDLRSMIKKVAEFLGKTLNDQQVKDLEDHLSFASMQKNPAVNHEHLYDFRDGKFIRSGEVGQWRTVMSEELIDRFDEWIRANSKEF